MSTIGPRELHSLCDAICGVAAQVNDVIEVIDALLGFTLQAHELDGNLDTEQGRHLVEYTVRLANALALVESVAKQIEAVEAARSELERSNTSLNRERWMSTKPST